MTENTPCIVCFRIISSGVWRTVCGRWGGEDNGVADSEESAPARSSATTVAKTVSRFVSVYFICICICICMYICIKQRRFSYARPSPPTVLKTIELEKYTESLETAWTIIDLIPCQVAGTTEVFSSLEFANSTEPICKFFTKL